MLNIHSFLPKSKGREKQSDLRKCKMGITVMAYTMIAVIAVLSLETPTARGVYAAEVNAGIQAPGVSALTEEADKFAHIQPEKNLQLTAAGEKLVKISQIEVKDAVESYTVKEEEISLQTAIAEAEQKKEERRIAEEAARKAEEERKAEEAAKKKAAKEKAAKKKAAKEEKERKEREAREAGKIVLSDSDKNILLRIVEAEATSEDTMGRMLVANVILNRVKSKKFPNTVEKVVFQSDGGSCQFSPIKDGRYYSVKVSQKTKTAVNRVLNGEDNSNGALYFMARKKSNQGNVRWFDTQLTWLMQYGNHEFYK